MSADHVGSVPVLIERAIDPLRGRIRVPGSKSLSTRAVVLAAIAPKPVLIRNLLVAADTLALIRALSTMGARVGRLFGTDWCIDGADLRSGPAAGDASEVRVDLGDGGAPTRFAMALATIRPGATIIDGSARMRERPVAEGVVLLQRLGANIEFVDTEGRLPLRVHGGIHGALGEAPPGRGVGTVASLEIGRTASSQFLSSLMLIAPALPHGLTLIFTEPPTSASYLTLTVESLRHFGAKVIPVNGPHGGVAISHGLDSPDQVDIPADASSAVAWVAAAAVVPGSRIELEGVARDSQPDVAAIEALGQMGARLTWDANQLVVEHGDLHGIDIDAEGWPDGALAVAAAACSARTPSRLRSLGTLRVKESDRLAAMCAEFGRLGAHVRIEGDDLVIDPAEWRPGLARGREPPAHGRERTAVDVYRDHRMAMALAIVGLARGGVLIGDSACVAKSYPEFWRDLARLSPSATSTPAPV